MSLQESDFISLFKDSFPQFIGDDAAVLSSPKNSSLLPQVFTKDLLLEDVHFRKRYFSPKDLAYKALQVNLSDIVAMGALPTEVMLGISAPKSESTYLYEFAKHFIFFCQQEKITLIGGDTTTSPDKIFLSITAIGRALPEQELIYRHTLKSGDYLCVIGNLGYAQLGLTLLELESQRKFSEEITHCPFKKALLQPQARKEEALWLAKNRYATAMMDLSDGIFCDVLKMCESSNVTATLLLENFLKLNFKKNDSLFFNSCQERGLSPIETIIMGGEDYSLLVGIKSENFSFIEKEFLKKFSYPIKLIGKVNKKKEKDSCARVCYFYKGAPYSFQSRPFTHF